MRVFAGSRPLYLETPGKNSGNTPPPSPAKVVDLWRPRQISATTPPPTKSRRLLQMTENLAGDIGRVAPQKKLWLRRFMTEDCNLFLFTSGSL